MEAVLEMAKKKTGPKPKPESRDSLIAMKCRASYKEWVVRIATAERSTPSDLLDRAQMENLPKLPNVVFMAGRKFGSAGAEDLTCKV